jgi:hypothetical protein
MQQRVLLGAGAALAVAALFALRGAGHHEAAKATDQNIQQLLANLPPGYQITHGAIDYNSLTASATIHDVRITREGRVNWTAETVTIAGADQKALRDVFDPAAYPAGKPAWSERRLLIADLAAHNIHAAVQGAHPIDYQIRSVSLHRLSGRPFAFPPSPENRAKPEFSADAALAFAADSFEDEDTRVDDPGNNQTKLSIDRIETDNYDAGKLASLLVRGVTLDAKDKKNGPVHISLASLSVKDVDARAVLQSVQLTGKPDKAAAGKTTYSVIDLGAMDFTSANAVSVQWHGIHAEQGIPDANGMRESRASLHAMTIGLGGTPIPPKIDAAINAFGMRSLTLDAEGSVRTLPGIRTELTQTLTLKDLGILRIKAAVSGYTALADATGPAAIGALMNTTIESANLRWEDRSLTDRIFKVAAAQENTTPELVRAQLAVPILAAAIMVPDQPDVADQLTAFLSKPDSLTITLAPPQPRKLAEIANTPATERAHALGLHITANQ